MVAVLFLVVCSLIMSQAAVPMTTPSVTVVHSSASYITTTVTMAPTTVGLVVSGQHYGVLLPLLIIEDLKVSSFGLATMPQQQQLQSHLASQANANYSMGPPQVSFSLSELSLPPISYVGTFYGACFLLSGSNVPLMLTSGANH